MMLNHTPFFTTLLAILLAYLFGSIASAILVCKLMQLPDPRTQGSENPGATNVLRIGGKVPALLTLLGDVLKGVIPVLLAKWYGLNEIALSCVAFAALLGHLYPLFFQFRGGKGIATLIGCLLALNVYVGLCFLATWLIVAILFRYSSLASIIASLLAPFYFYYFSENVNATFIILAMIILLIYRHRGNIVKLRMGVETKIGLKTSKTGH